MDPIAAFHRLEDLVERKNVAGAPADAVKALRGRLGELRAAPPSEWVAFYREALAAAALLGSSSDSGSSLTSAERRYLESLLADVREASNGIGDLWSRRLQDQRDELLSKAKEEVAQLMPLSEVSQQRLRVRISSPERKQWVQWLEHYLQLWTDRVLNEVPAGITKAQKDSLSRAPATLAPHVPSPPAVPTEAFSPGVDADWSGLSVEGPVAGAWSLFGKSIRGGIFAVMMVATITGSAAAAFQGGTQSPLRALIVLLLLIPVVIWARISSQNQRRTAVETLRKQLESQVRQRLLQLTQSRIDARQRSLRGWLQRSVRAARTEAQSWMRAQQLEIAERADRAPSRSSAVNAEIIDALQARIEELEQQTSAIQ